MAYNLLTDRLPDALTIGGKRYPIRTDFRRWILVTELFAETLADGKVKADCAAKLIFPAESPLDDLCGLSAAETGERYRTLVQAVKWFAVCGRMIRPVKNGSAGVQTEAVFDFTADAERIAAAKGVAPLPGTASGKEIRTELIILGTFLFVTQNFIRLGKFFKLLFRFLISGITVRVVFDRKFPVHFFDLIGSCGTGDAESGIKINCHSLFPFP